MGTIVKFYDITFKFYEKGRILSEIGNDRFVVGLNNRSGATFPNTKKTIASSDTQAKTIVLGSQDKGRNKKCYNGLYT